MYIRLAGSSLLTYMYMHIYSMSCLQCRYSQNDSLAKLGTAVPRRAPDSCTLTWYHRHGLLHQTCAPSQLSVAGRWEACQGGCWNSSIRACQKHTSVFPSTVCFRRTSSHHSQLCEYLYMHVCFPIQPTELPSLVAKWKWNNPLHKRQYKHVLTFSKVLRDAGLHGRCPMSKTSSNTHSVKVISVHARVGVSLVNSLSSCNTFSIM